MWEWPGECECICVLINRADYFNMQVLTFQLLFLLLISCHYATGMCSMCVHCINLSLVPPGFIFGYKVTHHSHVQCIVPFGIIVMVLSFVHLAAGLVLLGDV